MKSAIKALLGAVGLAPAGLVERLTEDVQRAASKAAQSGERLIQLRADAETWKRRHDEATESLGGWKQAATRAQADTERIKTGADRIKADLERSKAEAERERARADEWKARAEALTVEIQNLRGRLDNARVRLEEAQRATSSSREQLMAMEVKLDLIEAAIQVLDTRTREAALTRS